MPFTMTRKTITLQLITLLIAITSVSAQMGLPADEGMMSLAHMPAFRALPERAEPGLSKSAEPKATTVEEQFTEHLDMLQSQLGQLAYLQDQLDKEYLRLSRLREASLTEAEALHQMANEAMAQNPRQEMPYREEILLLEQQATQCDQQLRVNEQQRRLQQQMVEDIQAQIAEQQEEKMLWQELQQVEDNISDM